MSDTTAHAHALYRRIRSAFEEAGAFLDDEADEKLMLLVDHVSAHPETQKEYIGCVRCGHKCPTDAMCPKCVGYPMELGDTLCVDCDADMRDAPEDKD